MAEHQSLRRRISGLHVEYNRNQEILSGMLDISAMTHSTNVKDVLTRVEHLRKLAHDVNLLEVVLWDLTVRDSVV